MSFESFEAYLSTGWQDHSIDPRRVIESFPEGLSLLEADPANETKLPDFARLIEHTYLGHLGVAGEVEPWLQILSGKAFELATSRNGLARMAFAAEVSHGLFPALPSIPDDQQLSGCANGLVAHCVSDVGVAALAWLVQFASELPSASRSRAKAMAGAMNSLSFHLMLFPLAGVAQHVMVSAAALSRDAAQQSGQWRDVARAEHFLTTAHVAAGQGPEAMESARRCVALYADNAASAQELLSAADALARAAAAAGEPSIARGAIRDMVQLLTDIPDPETHAQCEKQLRDVLDFVESQLAGISSTPARSLATAPAAA